MLICDWRSGRDGVNREVVDFLETESSILWVQIVGVLTGEFEGVGENAMHG